MLRKNKGGGNIVKQKENCEEAETENKTNEKV
jgi:hypothetical protein